VAGRSKFEPHIRCDTVVTSNAHGEFVIRTASITFDGATKDAMQRAVRDALIAFMAATAQAQAEATKEAQRAGIAHAKANEGAKKPQAELQPQAF
jgi:putative DNA-invertase from lambdoid prophage Rac